MTDMTAPPVTIIQPTRGLASLQLRAVWQYRELLGFLAWRDVKVRYKQTALGVAWIVLQPLLSTVVFTLIFGGLLKVPSDGAPYALFALAALVPWQYFSGSLSRVGTSLVNSSHLISKVYFPRLIIPLSGVSRMSRTKMKRKGRNMNDRRCPVIDRTVLAVAFLIGILLAAHPSVVIGQSTHGDWSEPAILFEAEGTISEPTLAADQTGQLHAFWTYQEKGLTPAIFYARLRSSGWTEPVDIAVAVSIQGPSAVADQFGRLHLIWHGSNNTLFYSSARVEQATSALSWTSPTSIVVSSNPHAHMVADQQGNLHVAYPGTEDSGVFHVVSADGGATWPPSNQIAVPANTDATTDFARIAVTPNGTLHVVWTELQLPFGVPYLGIYYAQSKDGGQTWTKPQAIGSAASSIEANIVAVNDNEVHLAWNEQATVSGRYLRWSDDGGVNWFGPITIASPGLHGGSTNPPGLAVDGAGTIHAVVNTQPSGVVGGDATMYIHGRKGEWSPPQDVSQRAPNYIGLTNEASAIAITAGNRISIVFVDNDGARLWHTWRYSSADSTVPIDFAAPISDSSIKYAAQFATPQAETTSTALTAAATIQAPNPGIPVPATMNTSTILVASVAPVLLLVGSVLLFRLTRRR